MEKTYKVSEEKKNKALDLLSEHGQIFPDGSFEISGVEGYYQEKGDTIRIVITDKPWLASWEMIEKKLDNFFK